MARLRLLQPYNNQQPGEILELPGGVASMLVLRKIAELDTPQPTVFTVTGLPPAPEVLTRDIPGPKNNRRTKK